jgi:putative membrane fusion protein
MTVDQIETAINTVTENGSEESDALGKLITSYVWYLGCVVDANEVASLKNGSKVNVALKDSDDTVLNCQIVSGAEVQPGAEKTALILQCSDMNAKIANLRCTDIEIRIKEYEGIKVPASAVHVKDDKKGVYALVSSQVNFREAEVIYTYDDFVMLSFEEGNPNGIRLYDKIITQGKELEDGRVFT